MHKIQFCLNKASSFGEMVQKFTSIFNCPNDLKSSEH